MRMRLVVTAGWLAVLLWLSCTSDSPVQDSGGFVNRNSRVSECGGFPSVSRTAADPDSGSIELLIWTYDTKTRTLTVLNRRVNLNCCGEHSIKASRVGEEIVISENDQPLDGGRCRCMCNFDFSTEIEGLSPGAVNLRLELTVDDTLFMKWSGTIRLTDGSGEIQIQKGN